eukprot:scaffold34643_cov62-Phaeocystis_antarctica.AAC.1
MQVGSPGARRRRSVSKEQVGSPQVVSPRQRRRSGSLPSVLIYTKPALRITGRWAPDRVLTDGLSGGHSAPALRKGGQLPMLKPAGGHSVSVHGGTYFGGTALFGGTVERRGAGPVKLVTFASLLPRKMRAVSANSRRPLKRGCFLASPLPHATAHPPTHTHTHTNHTSHPTSPPTTQAHHPHPTPHTHMHMH